MKTVTLLDITEGKGQVDTASMSMKATPTVKLCFFFSSLKLLYRDEDDNCHGVLR